MGILGVVELGYTVGLFGIGSRVGSLVGSELGYTVGFLYGSRVGILSVAGLATWWKRSVDVTVQKEVTPGLMVMTA